MNTESEYTGKPQQNTKEIKIQINPLREKRKISRLLYGSNLAPKMESEPDIIKFVNNIGLACFRFPGGHQGYRWKTGSFDYDTRCANSPLRNIDYLIEFCKKTGTKLILQVNVESGSAKEAAEWVANMNKKSGFYVEYWELGNEVYGEWDKGYMSAGRYADVIKEYAKAMKTEDPNIKIGANWAPARHENFNIEVIKSAADYIDFLSLHWYPNHINAEHKFEGRIHPTPEEVIANSMQIEVLVKRANEIIAQYAPQKTGKIEACFLEWDGAWDGPNSDFKPYSQGITQWSLANAIFYADCFGQFMQNNVTLSAHYDMQSINFGLIRGWDKDSGWGGYRWDGEIIRPKALAIKLFSQNFADVLVESTVTDAPYYYKKQDWWADSYSGKVPYISCYAAKSSQGEKLTIALINKHSDKPFKTTIELQGVIPDPQGEMLILHGPSISSQNDGRPNNVQISNYKIENIKPRFNYTIPPHSVVLLKINYIQQE